MARLLQVAAAQVGGLTGCVADNLDVLAGAVREAATLPSGGTADLVVLPELSTTPYFCATREDSAWEWAQPVPGPATDRMAALAKALGTAIVFGLFERGAEGKFHDSVAAVSADGELVPWSGSAGQHTATCRKLSLPKVRLGGADIDEKAWFSPGTDVVVADLAGTRVGCLVCYDRSFPEYWALARARGAEVVVVPTSSAGFREDLFLAELQTRAMEAQLWVVAVNRAGPETFADRTIDFFGRSTVVAPDGRIRATLPAHRAGAVLQEQIDLDEVGRTRDRFRLGADRRPEFLDRLARSWKPEG